MDPDLEKQRNATFWAFNDIASKNPIPEMAIVDFHMIPSNSHVEWEKMSKELQGQGFTVERHDDPEGPMMEIRTRPLALSAEVIWEYEERLTLLARRYNFKPDGWGFSGVSTNEGFVGV